MTELVQQYPKAEDCSMVLLVGETIWCTTRRPFDGSRTQADPPVIISFLVVHQRGVGVGDDFLLGRHELEVEPHGAREEHVCEKLQQILVPMYVHRACIREAELNHHAMISVAAIVEQGPQF